MAIITNDNYHLRAPKPIDDRGGFATGGTWNFYSTVADFLANSPYRFPSMTVPFTIGGEQVEYWFVGGIEDSDFVLKIGSGLTPNLQQVTTGVGNNITSNAIQVTGFENIDFTTDSFVLAGNENSTAAASLIRIFDNGSSITSLEFLKESPTIAGLSTVSRMSGADALNVSDFTTLGQVEELISDIPPVDLTPYQLISQKNQPNGYAGLDTGAKIFLSQLPDSILGALIYQGTWAAATNTPTLIDPAPSETKGFYYVVDTAGTQFGLTFAVGDWIVSNGSEWQKVDNSDAVTTVFGRIGNILANESDYSVFYPLLSGSYANPSWITSLAYSKLTGTPNLGLYELLANKQNSLATDGTGVRYPTVDAVNSGLSLKQSNLSIINVKDYGAVGDGITDDTDAIADAIDAGNIIYFPKTANHYRCTITLRKSNMTFIIPEGVVLDGGVFHIEGIGPGTSDWNPGDPIQYRENIRVIGKLSLTSRLGTYYAKNLFFDDVEIVADSSIYINQTAEGGSRGVHFYWGTENVFVNRMITRSTKAGESYGGLFIDANPAYVTESKPRNFYINELSIPESKFNGIWLYEVENLYFGNVNINSPLYLGIYADEVDNMSINQASIYDAGESSIQYQNSNNITIQNIISNNPSIFDVNNVSGTNVNIGYNQPLSFATDPFSQTGFSKLNISSYNDLKDRPIISGVLSDNLEIGSGVYGLLKIKGSVGALIDFYKGSTLLGEMGMEEVDVNTSQYKFYTRSGGSTFNGLSLVGDKVIVPTAPTNPTDVVRLTDLANYVNTTADQVGIAGNKTWTGIGTYNSGGTEKTLMYPGQIQMENTSTRKVLLDPFSLTFTNGAKIGALQPPVGDGNFNYNLPSGSGTLALTSQLTDFVDKTNNQTGIGGVKTWTGENTWSNHVNFTGASSLFSATGLQADFIYSNGVSFSNPLGRHAAILFDALSGTKMRGRLVLNKYDAGNSSGWGIVPPTNDNNGGTYELPPIFGATETLAVRSDIGTGWAQYTDNVYTSGSPLVVNLGSTATITNNASVIINSQLPDDVTSFYDPTTSKITPSLNGDSYLINVRFTALSSSITGLADIELDVTGAVGALPKQTISLRKGIGNTQQVNIIFDVFSASAFVANGGLIKLTSVDGNTSIYDISYKITRVHKAR